MPKTSSAHAGADLIITNPKTSAQFIEILNKAGARLPWECVNGEIFDADGKSVCEVGHLSRKKIAAEMIVVAVNTCGSFRATRRGE